MEKYNLNAEFLTFQVFFFFFFYLFEKIGKAYFLGESL